MMATRETKVIGLRPQRSVQRPKNGDDMSVTRPAATPADIATFIGRPSTWIA